jgi:predicted MFS family arabinose efflux permease
MNPSERRLIGYIAAAHALTHIIELTYPLLLTQIEDDFGITAVISGAIATIFGLAFGTTAIPSGFLTDRLGSPRVLVYAFGGAAVMTLLVSLAPNAWFLAVALAGLGFTIGLYHPAGLSATAQGIHQRGMALGLHGAAGNLGQAVAPVIVVGLAILVDWRLAYLVLAGLSALLAIAITIAHLPVDGESEILSAEEVVEPPAEDHTVPANNLLFPLLVTYAAFVLSGIVYRGAITFLPQLFEEFVNDEFGAAFVTVALILGAVGQLAGGSISQRVRLERIAPAIGLCTIPALLLTGVLSGAALVLAASVFVFFYFANQPIFTGLIADYSPAGAVGRSYGFSFFAGFGLGSIGGIIAGAFVDQWGIQSAFLGLTVFMALVVGLSFLLWTMAERRQRDGELAAALEMAS